MTNENNISRRGLFMKLGILFNGLVATALAVPIVRFLLSSVIRGPASAVATKPLNKIPIFMNRPRREMILSFDICKLLMLRVIRN